MKNYWISSKALLVTALLTLTITLFLVTQSDAFGRANRRNIPAKVTQLQAVQQGDGILLSWKEVDGCDSYRVYHEKGRALRPDSFWVSVSGQTSYLFTDVTTGERYSFRVSAINGRKEGRLSTKTTVLVKHRDASTPSDIGK